MYVRICVYVDIRVYTVSGVYKSHARCCAMYLYTISAPVMPSHTHTYTHTYTHTNAIYSIPQIHQGEGGLVDQHRPLQQRAHQAGRHCG